MKVLLTTLNARYIHSSLALRYLEKYCQSERHKISDQYEIVLEEYTINDQIDKITAAIYKTGADIVGFSCYIWNIIEILEIADRLKKVKPGIIIILGGPEVSYDAPELLERYPFIDYIIRGEGEEPFKQLLTNQRDSFTNGRNNLTNYQDKLEEIPGLVYRDENNRVRVNENRYPLFDLEDVPRPYRSGDLQKLSDKIIYYETSRGCPFNCSYCLSSTTSGVRYFPLERVKEDLRFFIENNVRLVKFVDRTFNANKMRALEIFKFLVENRKNTCFHFEIAADLFDEEIIEYLAKVPAGLFRFEIGVQSTNPDTIRAIERKMDFEKVAENVRRLREAGNIHLHLDLIAGLPEEDYSSFKESFDDVYSLSPQILQLGFLKLLKGSKIREQAQQYNYRYTSIPPYEMLENDFLSYEEVIKLKRIEDILEKYHNSGAFRKSLSFILHKFYGSPFQFFADLVDYFEAEKLDRISHSRKALYDILYEFYSRELDSETNVFTQFLKFDLLLNNRGAKLPYWADSIDIPLFKEKCYRFLKNEKNIEEFLPGFKGMSVRKILSRVAFAAFTINVLSNNFEDIKEKQTVVLFDYVTGKAYNITGKI